MSSLGGGTKVWDSADWHGAPPTRDMLFARRRSKEGSRSFEWRVYPATRSPADAELQRRLNRALQGDLPHALRRRRQPLAADLVLIPYHGKPLHSPEEVYRSKAKSGTSHFHAYATA
jgi:hypothetical protein